MVGAPSTNKYKHEVAMVGAPSKNKYKNLGC
jgi:hypothetical protein